MAIVTGASRGIGLAIVKQLAADGVDVVAASRHGLAPDETCAGVREQLVDLTDVGAAARIVDYALERFGSVDILVNNLGGVRGGQLGGFLDIPDGDWRRTWDVNLLSMVRTCRAVLPHMLESGSGSIVCVSSILARDPYPPLADYSAAKCAVRSVSKSLSLEFAPRGVRVNCVSPGAVAGAMWDEPHGLANQLSHVLAPDAQSVKATVANAASIGRFVAAEEVARLVGFLCSPKASAITGVDYVIDGGRVSGL